MRLWVAVAAAVMGACAADERATTDEFLSGRKLPYRYQDSRRAHDDDALVKPHRRHRLDDLKARVREERDLAAPPPAPPPPFRGHLHADVLPSHMRRKLHPPPPPGPPHAPPPPPVNATPPVPPPDPYLWGLRPGGEVETGDAANASACVRYDEFTCPLLSPRDVGGECRERAESWHAALKTRCEHGWDEQSREWMLKKLKNRLLLFLGDSVLIQQWTSLVCLLGQPVKHWKFDDDRWDGVGSGPTAGCALYRGGTTLCAALEETFEPNGVRGNLGLAGRLNRLLSQEPKLLLPSDIVVMGLAGAYGTPQRRVYRAGLRSLARWAQHNMAGVTGDKTKKGARQLPLLVWRAAPHSHYPVGMTSAADFEAYEASNFTMEIKKRLDAMRRERDDGKHIGAEFREAPPPEPPEPPRAPVQVGDLVNKDSYGNAGGFGRRRLAQDGKEQREEGGEEEDAAENADVAGEARAEDDPSGVRSRFDDDAAHTSYGLDAAEPRSVCWSPETGQKLAEAAGGAEPGTGEAADGERALWQNEGILGEFDLHKAGIAVLTLRSPTDPTPTKRDYLQHPGRRKRHASTGFLAGSESDMDCTHWCLPGKPDVWNRRLMNLIHHVGVLEDLAFAAYNHEVTREQGHVFAKKAFDEMLYEELVSQTLIGDPDNAISTGQLGLTPQQAIKSIDNTMRYELLSAMLRTEAEHQRARAHAAKVATELREAGEKLGAAGHGNRNFLSEPALFPPGQGGGSYFAESFVNAITMRGVDNTTGIGVTFEADKGTKRARKGKHVRPGRACFRWLSAWGGARSGFGEGSSAAGETMPEVFVAVNFERAEQQRRWEDFKKRKNAEFNRLISQRCNFPKAKPGKQMRDLMEPCLAKHKSEVLRQMDQVSVHSVDGAARPDGLQQLFPEGAGSEELTDSGAALWHAIGRPWGATGDFVGCVELPRETGWMGTKYARHYTYKFLVDGVWRTSPASEYRLSRDGEVVNVPQAGLLPGAEADPAGWYLPCVPFHVNGKREIYGPMGRIAEGGIASLVYEPYCLREDVLAPATRQWGQAERFVGNGLEP